MGEDGKYEDRGKKVGIREKSKVTYGIDINLFITTHFVLFSITPG